MNKFIIIIIIISNLNNNLLSCEKPLEEAVTKVMTGIANNDLNTIKAIYDDCENKLKLTKHVIRLIDNDTIIYPEVGDFIVAKTQELKTAYTSFKKSRPEYKGIVLEWTKLGILLDPLVDTDGMYLNTDGKRKTKTSVFDAEWIIVKTAIEKR